MGTGIYLNAIYDTGSGNQKPNGRNGTGIWVDKSGKWDFFPSLQ